MIVIELFKELFKLATPVALLLAYIFCFPQLILKKLKLTVINEMETKNILALTLNLIFYSLYIFTHLNLHLIYFFKYYLGVDSILQLIISYLIMNGLTAIIYRVTDMKFFIFEDVPRLIHYFFYESIWIFILVLIIFSFFDKDLMDFLMFRKLFMPYEFLSLISFGFFAIVTFLKYLLIHIFFMAHLFNPISFIRAFSIVKREYNWHIFRTITKSALYIPQDFILLIIIPFNCLFLRSFIINVKNLITDYYNNNYQIKFLSNNSAEFSNPSRGIKYLLEINNLEGNIDNLHFYIYFKYYFILKQFKSNFKFFFVIIFSLLSFVFFWKIPKIINTFLKFIENDDFKQFSLNVGIIIIDGFMDFITPVILLYNHIIPINYFSLYKIKKYYENYFTEEDKKKNEKIELSFSVLNIIVFINKGFDYVMTIISLTQIFNFTFLIYLIRKIKRGKFREISFFPLLNESESFIKYGREEYSTYKNEYPENNCMNAYINYLFNRRIQILILTIKNILDNILIIINSISLFDPFYGFRYIRNIYLFVQDSLIDNSEIKLIEGIPYFLKVSFSFTAKLFKNLLYSFVNFILFIPLNLIFALTAPWCLFEFLIFSYNFSYKNPIQIIKKHSKVNNKERNKFNMPLISKIKTQTLLMFSKWLQGWILILKFVTMHLTIIRGFLLWREFYFLKNYRKQKLENMNNKLIKKFSVEIELNDETINLNSPQLSFGFKRQLSTNTETFIRKTDHSIFKFVLDKNFDYFLKEFIFYPFIYIILIISPWSIFRLNKFIKSKSIKEKFKEFIEILINSVSDIITIIKTLFVLISMVNTIKGLTLIYHELKKNIKNLLGHPNWSDEYDNLYKDDFKNEIKNLSSGIVQNLIIFLLIILNILLISRIFSVFRRIKRFIIAHIARDISKLKHIFDRKIETDRHLFTGLSNRVCSSIFEFLNPGMIYNLQLANKVLYHKANLNLVWMNLFNNYYLQVLKVSSTPEVYNLIMTKKYTNYKLACQEASQYTNIKVELTESERDSLIGALNVMIEETVESFLKIPHLILIPAKIISIPLKLIRNFCLNIHDIFTETNFYQNYLKQSYIHFKFAENDFIDLQFNESYDNLFYNMQLIGIKSILELFILLVGSFLSIVTSIFVIFIKIITFSRIRINNNITDHLTINDKINGINNIFLICYQFVLGIIFVIIHFIILIYPSYYFHREGYNQLINKSFENGFDLFNLFYFIENVLAVWWNKGFFGRLYFLFFGTYFTNIWSYLFIIYLCYIWENLFKFTNIFIFDIVKYVYVIQNGLIEAVINNLGFVIQIGLFPQIYLAKLILRKINSIMNNKIIVAILNILILFLILYPFYLNFKITFSYFKFLCLNVYAVTNMIKLVDVFK